MKYLVVRLILTVSLPIIIGVGVVLTIFYKLLWQALDQWQEDSGIWINQTQQQILYNSIYSQQILLEYSFNQLELHMVAMKGLLKKYESGQMIYKSQSSYTYCSYREFMFNECPKNVYSQINESIFYVQLYFVRSVFKFELLTPEQQYFIKMNEDLSFYSGAAFLASQSDGLIQISNIYNSDTTSLQVVSPSVLYNYTQASYQTCNGDQFIEPYDARCRFWFQYAEQYPGIFIYQPYNDALTGTLELSLSSQVLKDSKFYSVHTINFVMQNLVQIFNGYLSQNSYSVLFHEFNTTVLYHPLLVFYQKMTWVDVEFLNINQFCSDQQEILNLCQSQKEQLSSQVNKTVSFIKTGNYSIEKQYNLDQLYQYWDRFGQKQFVYPTLNNIWFHK
ncbi:tetratricopeptide repeat protein (macronuclear) [Tetrahymena thermophila SB210]|uniref:Tetratricopeptide repeat protein n=1 Tax=Tetrahymena thermophila (strain SB210) TaxID=312017 RepID=W7WYG5_TETTS|nr:tetratricopeptide repeat protein [Tetrahymena thermophila SB210]EWS71905.1 tetratricopeptide repeat protein [Tetrahymena thermophila SB210]|eukprot:XP_012655562.1 tetratricopeptide repeat protein [Tetrahymena thermophila SB210]